MPAPKTKFGVWTRRSICIAGGAVTASVLVFVYAITMKPVDGTTEERLHLLAVDGPIAAIVGSVIGAVIVLRTEKLEARRSHV